MTDRKKIVYLLGAGASRGKRHTDNGGAMPADGNNIIEGLPVVNEINGRLNYVRDLIANFRLSEQVAGQLIKLPDDTQRSFGWLKDRLVEDFDWLIKESSETASIDTFAKRLFLGKDVDSLRRYYRVEVLLCIFFILEQRAGKHDVRYDVFLETLYGNGSAYDFPDNVTILSWNYDIQMEMAYHQIVPDRSYDEVRHYLGLYDGKDGSYPSIRNMHKKTFKLNGSAQFKNDRYDVFGHGIDEPLISYLLERYAESFFISNEAYDKTSLTFAWAGEQYVKGDMEKNLEDAISDAKVLVVIGYTFPGYNRDVDRFVISKMPLLEKIYIQDPNASYVHFNLDNMLPEGTVIPDIQEITFTDNFLVPKEF